MTIWNWALRISVIIAVLAILGVFQLILHGERRRIWHFMVWAIRTRFSWLQIVGPALIGILGLTGARSLLYGVLQLRYQNDFFFIDTFNITCLSLMTIAVGLATLRIFELYGDLRIGTADALLDGPARFDEPELPPPGENQANRLEPQAMAHPADEANPAVPPQHQVAAPTRREDLRLAQALNETRNIGWPRWKFYVWAAFGLAFPCLAVIVSLYEFAHRDDATMVGVLLGGCVSLAALVAATACSLGVLFLLGRLQSDWLGPAAQPCGLLPYERMPPLDQPIPRFFRYFLDGPGSFVAWWFRGPGYTDPKTRALLPGHVQMQFLAIVSGLTYAAWYTHAMLSDWSHYLWPASFYVLLLVFYFGWQLSGLSFWMDRYGVPPGLIVLIWVSGVYWLGQSDHIVRLNMEVAHTPVAQTESAEANTDRPALSTLLFPHVPPHPEPPHAQLLLSEVLKGIELPPGADGKRTLVVITAAGGGIQAAAWAAKVMTELDRLPGFSQSVGLISSVSGGSVGTLYYLAHRGPRINDSQHKMELTPKQVQTINDCAQASSLEGVAWGVAFPDLVRSVFPPLAPSIRDRGWALESTWWNRMGRDGNDREQMREIHIRDLVPAIRDHRMPAVVFNSTAVETGQRVLISPLDTTPKFASQQTNYVDQPIDFLSFYSTDHLRANPRLSTVVRLSSTFSYVSPVTRPSTADADAYRKFLEDQLVQKKLPPDQHHKEQKRIDELVKRFGYHFCDGGYSDNSGLVTAVRLVQDVVNEFAQRLETEQQVPQLAFDRILIVRIEPFPRDRAKTASDHSGFSSEFFGPNTAMYATRVSSQAERSGLEVTLLQESARHRLGQISAQAYSNFLVAQNGFTNASQTLSQIVNKAETTNSPKTSEKLMARISGFLPPAPLWPPSAVLTQPETQKYLQHVDAAINAAADMTRASQEFARTVEAEAKPEFTDRQQAVEASAQKVNETGKKFQQISQQSIEVKSITFRFEFDIDSTRQPPLSWTLAPTEVNDIDRVWLRLEANLDTGKPQAPDTVSFKDLEAMFGKLKPPPEASP